MPTLSATPVIETNLPEVLSPQVMAPSGPPGLDPAACYFTIKTDSGTGNAQSSPADTYIHRFRDNKAVDVIFDWGDGTPPETVDFAAQTGVVETREHQYATPGTYQIKVTKIPGTQGRFNFFFNNLGDRRKIQSVDQWGSEIAYNSFFYSFMGCFNMTIEATDAPITSSTTSASNCFRSCTKITGGLAHWNFNQFTNMFQFIRTCTQFNEDLNNIVANENTTFNGFARDCGAYTHPLSNITAPKCTNYSRLLQDAVLVDTSVPIQWDMTAATNISSSLRGLGNQPTLRLDLLAVTSKVNNYTGLLTDTTMSTENYSNTLIAWDAIATLKSDETLGMGDATYNTAGGTARASLIAKWNWVITDGGPA